ncbi:MAG: hypothetical protein E6618_13995, partial [Staphylococcus warneri]|nr:hypothetical protein [Staphylococcus warneri]
DRVRRDRQSRQELGREPESVIDELARLLPHGPPASRPFGAHRAACRASTTRATRNQTGAVSAPDIVMHFSLHLFVGSAPSRHCLAGPT